MAWNPYTKTTSSISYYGSVTGNSEPNMRQELINTFDGSFPEIAKAQDGLLRRMRLDSDDRLIPCDCVDSLTNEPDRDRFCPICYGEGFLWDEENIEFYRVLKSGDTDNATKNKLREMGLINVPIVIFYVKYDSDITRHDKIVRVELDTEGDVVVPQKRVGIYRIESVWDYRADNGKLEYWKVFTHWEDVRYLNPPSYGDI